MACSAAPRLPAVTLDEHCSTEAMLLVLLEVSFQLSNIPTGAGKKTLAALKLWKFYFPFVRGSLCSAVKQMPPLADSKAISFCEDFLQRWTAGSFVPADEIVNRQLPCK